MQIDYQLRRSTRARSMRIVVHPDARVIVTIPLRCSAQVVQSFLTKHAAWIEKAVARNRHKKVIRYAQRDIALLKERAAALAAIRGTQFAEIYGVQFQKIVIRAQKSRWGSCSARRTLSFNYTIAVLPRHLQDYIIAHEICHLSEMNHSKKFWDLVARTIPEHKKLRYELRATVVLKEA